MPSKNGPRFDGGGSHRCKTLHAPINYQPRAIDKGGGRSPIGVECFWMPERQRRSLTIITVADKADRGCGRSIADPASNTATLALECEIAWQADASSPDARRLAAPLTSASSSLRRPSQPGGQLR